MWLGWQEVYGSSTSIKWNLHPTKMSCQNSFHPQQSAPIGGCSPMMSGAGPNADQSVYMIIIDTSGGSYPPAPPSNTMPAASPAFSSPTSSCNPCACKDHLVPASWTNAGFSASGGYSPASAIPPPDGQVWTGQNSAGCYNSDTNGGPPIYQLGCDDSIYNCIDSWCQGQGYEFYWPGFNYATEAASYTNPPGICVLWHGGTVPSLGYSFVNLGPADCACGGAYPPMPPMPMASPT
jgi:hypothetical protein